jgi:hypothetical protein
MTNPDHHAMHDPPPSAAALRLFACLGRHGGSMRLEPLLRDLRIAPRDFIEAIIDLKERYWIRIVWHKAPPGTPDDEPRDYTEIERLVATRFGRRKYRMV